MENTSGMQESDVPESEDIRYNLNLSTYTEDNKLTIEAALALLDGLIVEHNIVELFRINGIKGKRCTSCECPIAVFLERVVGGHWHVNGVQAQKAINFDVVVVELDEKMYELPKVAQSFVYNFDAGHYSELVATHSEFIAT